MDETTNPEAEIEHRERKVSGTRTTSYAMRKSRASVESGMTPAMIDAEREIALGWTIQAGHMGYGSNDLSRVRGISERDPDQERRAIKRLSEWMNMCPNRYRQAVLDIAVFAKPISEISDLAKVSPRTVVRRFHRGLREYCKLHGHSR